MRYQPTDEETGIEPTSERVLRARRLFAEYRTLVLLVLVVGLLLGGWLTYGAYAAPGEETEQYVDHAWGTTGEFGHEATVEEDAANFEAGEQLRDEPLYFTSIAPVATVEYAAGYEAETGTDVHVGVEIELVWRAVDGDTVYWTERETVATASDPDVGPGESVTASGDLDLREVAERADEIEAELGASPGTTEQFLSVDHEVAGTIDGDVRTATGTERIDLEIDGGTYAFDAPTAFDETYESHATRTVPATPGPGERVSGPLLVVGSLLGLAAVGVASRRWDPLSTAEREWLAYRSARAEYEELVTTATLPEDVRELPATEVQGIDELAQVAIDVGGVLAYDPDRGRYTVVGDGLRYVYEPPAIPGGNGVPTAGLPTTIDDEPASADGPVVEYDGPDGESTGGQSVDTDSSPEETREDGAVDDETAATEVRHDGRTGPDRRR